MIELIKTPIISAANDAYWQEPGKVKDWMPKDVLVMTTPLAAGSEEAALLTKIMEACNLQPADYNLLQPYSDEKTAWYLLKEKLNPQTLILFGILPEQLAVAAYLMQHQTNRFDDRNWIPTASLADIRQHPEIKTHLWKYGLKPVFIDKIYT